MALIDVAKGAVPVALFDPWAALGGGWAAALGAVAVLGHVFSPFVGFKGGKGVATAAGMFLALAPIAVAIALPVWGLCLWLTGFVSLSSMVAAVTFPVWVRLTTPPPAAMPPSHAALTAGIPLPPKQTCPPPVPADRRVDAKNTGLTMPQPITSSVSTWRRQPSGPNRAS